MKHKGDVNFLCVVSWQLTAARFIIFCPVRFIFLLFFFFYIFSESMSSILISLLWKSELFTFFFWFVACMLSAIVFLLILLLPFCRLCSVIMAFCAHILYTFRMFLGICCSRLKGVG